MEFLRENTETLDWLMEISFSKIRNYWNEATYVLLMEILEKVKKLKIDL